MSWPARPAAKVRNWFATREAWDQYAENAIDALQRPHHVYAETHPSITTASADIATAIQPLLNAYKKVEFKGQGTYLTSQLTVPAGTTLIIPEGVTLKLKNGAEQEMLLIAGRVVGGGTLDGNRANQAATTKAVAYLYGTRSRIKDMEVKNAPGNGITIAGNSEQAIRCYVHDTDGYGIYAEADNPLIEMNEVAATAYAAIRVHAPAGQTILRPRVLSNDVTVAPGVAICIEVWGNDASSVIGPSVMGNVTNGGFMGLSMDKCIDGTATGNTVSAFTYIGLELAGSVSCTLSVNTVDGGNGVGTFGVSASNTGNKDNTITANAIRRCLGGGIHVFQGSGYTVSVNVITDGIHASYPHAIWMQDTPDSVVTANRIRAYSAGIKIQNASNATVSVNILTDVEYALNFGWGAGSYDYVTVIGNISTGHTFLLSVDKVGSTLGNNIVFRANPGLPDYLDYANNIIELFVTATPEASITAGVGSRAIHRTTGAVYRKTSGTGNTGWVTP